MAGSACTITEGTHGTVKKIKFAWTADNATGAVSATTTKYYTGKIEGLTTVPGTAGDAPDDNYNLTLTDGDSVDVLMSGGLLRDTANTEHVLATSLGCVGYSKLTLNVTAAGNSNKGTVYVWIR